MTNLKPSFSNPLSTNTKSCNELINRLSVSGSHRDVLLTYSSMLSNRTPPDAYTFPSLLKACTSLGLLSIGLSVHQHTIVNGYSSDTFISSSLVHFYSKFGDTHIARKVFDAMPERNVVPWSAIIGCYSRQGDVSIAFSLYNDMRHEEVLPNSVTVLGLLSGISEFQHLQCLHACVIQSGFQSDIHVGNSLLNLYGRCGKVEIARKLFESMDHKDLVSWNSLVSGYSQGGNVRQSVELLNRMRIEGTEPDHQTFGSVLSGIANECMLELGKLVHGQIITAGIGLDVQFVTTLIVMYLKCGNLENAFQLFHGIRDRDVVLWTAMISGLVQNDRADEALNIFYRMIESGLRPSSATVATALSACAQLGSLKHGSSIHGYFLRQTLQVDVTVQNSLVNMYSKCGHLEQSWSVFETISDKDLVTWNTIVASFAQDGHLRKALILFNEMRMANQRPDSITVVSLLQVCASFGALHQGKWIHNFVIRNGIGTCISIDTALIDMYSKCGVLCSAQTCFDMMPEQDLVSWSAIITAYGSHGKGHTALKIYSEFLFTGIQPNYVTFLSVLSACSHAGLVSEGMRIFRTMTEEFGIEPKLEHRACIVDLLSRAGQLQEAYSFVKREFPEPSIDVLGILLDACRTCRNSELGKIVAREIISLKPENAENYVQLAHSYASMSRWDGVGEALLQMRSLGLKKVPGWSCIELLGVITTFFVDHTSHPQHEEIMLMLNVVSREMQDRTSNYQVMQDENSLKKKLNPKTEIAIQLCRLT